MLGSGRRGGAEAHEAGPSWEHITRAIGRTKPNCLPDVPSLIMFVGFQYMPESPRWLVMEGRNEEARRVLMSIRDSDDEANSELEEIIQVCSLMTTTATTITFIMETTTSS